MRKGFERNLFTFLFHFMKKQWIGFVILAFACLANALSVSIWPKIIEISVDLIDQYSGNKLEFFTQHKNFFIGAILFWLSVEVLTRIYGVTMANVIPKFKSNLKLYLYSRTLNAKYDYHIQNKIGSIANKVVDMPRAAYYAIDIFFTDLIPFVISLVISSVFFLEINSQIALILFVWMTSHVALSFILCTYAANLSKVHARAQSNTQGGIVDSFTNILPVKLFSSFAREYQNVNGLQNIEIHKNRNAMYFVEFMNALLGLLGFFVIGFLFWRAISLWQTGIVTPGGVLLIFTSVLNLWTNVRATTEEIAYFVREIGVCQQSLDLLDSELENDRKSSEDLNVNNGEIVFDNVTFNYKYQDYAKVNSIGSNKHERRIFHNKSVKIEGGQKIGLIGFSGSGKTTFAKLLLKLFDIESGKIIIDGQDIAEVSLQSLRDNISFIPQDPKLFNRTILENIAYDNPNATIDQIEDAAKRSYCHEFISALPEGYSTVVGERGSMLSGGQSQRIMIARAILKDAPIVIMDEATSALDTFTERKIKKGLDYITKGKTTIIIAHRLSTLSDVDRILVFKDGQIIEDGAHAELLNTGKYYKMLWSLQAEGVNFESDNNDTAEAIA